MKYRYSLNGDARILSRHHRSLFEDLRENPAGACNNKEKAGEGIMKKILTFDCYGTLLDARPLYDLIAQLAMRNHLSSGKAVEIFKAYEDRLMYSEDFVPYDQLLMEILTYCDMEMNTDIFVRAYNDVINVHQKFQPFEDVMPALCQLKEKGYQLALVSNTTEQIMEDHLFVMDHVFDYILTAGQIGCYKPQLDFFKQTEKEFCLNEKDHSHIAKGYWWDVVPASKMGWNRI